MYESRSDDKIWERTHITSSTFGQFWTPPPLRHQDHHGSGPPSDDVICEQNLRVFQIGKTLNCRVVHVRVGSQTS